MRSSTVFSHMAISPIAPSLLRSSGIRPIPDSIRARTPRFAKGFPEKPDIADAWLRKTGHKMRQHRLAISGDADNAEYFTLAQPETDVFQPVHAVPPDRHPGCFQSYGAGRGRIAYRACHAVADHEFGQFRLAGLAHPPFCCHLAATQDDDAIGGGHHLIELVGNEDQGKSLLCHFLQRAEQALGFYIRQYRRRLVEDREYGRRYRAP